LLNDIVKNARPSIEDEKVIRWFAPYFDRRNYWDKVSIPNLDNNFGWNRLIPKNILQKESELYLKIWNLVFPKAKASDIEITKFIQHKCQLIARSPQELDLLRTLATSTKQIPQTSSLKNMVDTLNDRWSYFTGNSLIQCTQDNSMIFLEI
jgi:hypothetical protein